MEQEILEILAALRFVNFGKLLFVYFHLIIFFPEKEVSAINLLQLVNPRLQVYLVRFVREENNSNQSKESSVWATTVFQSDHARVEYHNRKMRSKDERPAEQMKALGIVAGSVVHVNVNV